MRRRDFLTLLGGAAATWPLAAHAQQTPMPLIGMLLSGSRASSDRTLRGFHQGLAESGYVEAGNVIIEYRWAEDRNERFPQLAAELVQRGVSVLVAIGSPAVAAAKAATTIIPIVFYVGVDPVSFGLVDSLGRPGGNLTGVTNFSLETGPKRLELLADLLGSRKLVGIPRIGPERKPSCVTCCRPRTLWGFSHMFSMRVATRSSGRCLPRSLSWARVGSQSAETHFSTAALGFSERCP
jgi:putative tryptophan/tyrosine transport system substrate-binding protein